MKFASDGFFETYDIQGNKYHKDVKGLPQMTYYNRDRKPITQNMRDNFGNLITYDKDRK